MLMLQNSGYTISSNKMHGVSLVVSTTGHKTAF